MTLVELIVAVVIGSIIMAGLTGLFINQTRLFSVWESERTSRDVVRSATEVLVGDLRRLEATGGVEAVSAESLTLRIPFAMGLVCSSSAGATVVSLLPTDSVMYASATPSGYAWRTANGYTYVSSITSLTDGSEGTCTAASISTITGARVISLAPGAGAAVPAGTPVFLYQRVQYAFESQSGGSVLTRTVLGGEAKEEVVVETLVTSGTRFRFYVDPDEDPVDTVPSALSTITGFDLGLEGRGNYPRLDGSVASTELDQAVFFRNTAP
jgi:hypothetical protein